MFNTNFKTIANIFKDINTFQLDIFCNITGIIDHCREVNSVLLQIQIHLLSVSHRK